MWSIGASTQPPWLLGALAIAFVIVFLLIQTENVRRRHGLDSLAVVMESVEALAIGILCAGMALFLLCVITFATPLSEILGKVVYQGISFSFGAALAASLLNGDRSFSLKRSLSDPSDSSETVGTVTSEQFPDQPLEPTGEFTGEPRENLWSETVTDLDATLIGAFIIALNIAPTDEISILATTIPTFWLLLIIGASLIISYVIVFAAGFPNQTERQQQQGWFQQPFNETLVAYLISLAVAVFVLWFFHQLDLTVPWQTWLSSTIVLGLPASIGGAAGRIVA
jgi:putative integral membrane protein (TIGR02587 family)